MSNTPTVSSLTNYESFRDALIARGYGDIDPADVPERVWNACLDLAGVAQ